MLPFDLPFDSLPRNITGSLVLIIALAILRYASMRLLKKTITAPSLQYRRWARSIKNTSWTLLIIGLCLIWAPQLRTFALSVTAIAVAIVVATKELILCFSGSFMRASSRAFTVGDWIQLGDIHGEVTDHNIFSSTLQELDSHSAHTGREIIFPNSLLLTTPVRNLSLLKSHTSHTFSVTVDPSPVWPEAHTWAKAIVQRHFEPYRELAEREKGRVSRRAGVSLGDDLEEIRFSTSDIGRYRVTISLFCPVSATDELQSGITLDILAYLHAHERIASDSAAQPEAT